MPRIYISEWRGESSTNGSEEKGFPHVEEWNLILISHPFQKMIPHKSKASVIGLEI